MGSYTVRLKSSALKELKQLPEKDAERVAGKIAALHDNPRPAEAKKLRLGENLWRIRIGNFRAVYEIDDEHRVVRVIRVRRRDEAYR